MLTKEPSFASLLVKQSPAMHYGHGWIMGRMVNAGIRAVHKMNCWQNYLRKNGGTNGY
ncbi:Protein of uncharacterised function (DUF2724) [Escherichia coli]|nr:Protein of uncharacterised function (DUF2724) [Escherichia coli]